MLQKHADATHQLALQMGSGPVAQWIRHRPTEPGIAGSSPARVICTTRRPAGVICTTRRLRNRPPQTQTKRHRGDSNPCGQSPMDFESISLAARTHCHLSCNDSKQVKNTEENASARNRARVASIAAIYSTTRPLILILAFKCTYLAAKST